MTLLSLWMFLRGFCVHDNQYTNVLAAWYYYISYRKCNWIFVEWFVEHIHYGCVDNWVTRLVYGEQCLLCAIVFQEFRPEMWLHVVVFLMALTPDSRAGISRPDLSMMGVSPLH
jgi:hypothetical protein